MLAQLVALLLLFAGTVVQSQNTTTSGTISTAIQKPATTASPTSTGSAINAASTLTPSTTTSTASVAVASNYINGSSSDNSPVHVTVDLNDTSRRNKTAPMLYGNMFEDISHSGDGGIYAELLRNRAFQGGQKRFEQTTSILMNNSEVLTLLFSLYFLLHYRHSSQRS